MRSLAGVVRFELLDLRLGLQQLVLQSKFAVSICTFALVKQVKQSYWRCPLRAARSASRSLARARASESERARERESEREREREGGWVVGVGSSFFQHLLRQYLHFCTSKTARSSE
jgi:hypothetical protein